MPSPHRRFLMFLALLCLVGTALGACNLPAASPARQPGVLPSSPPVGLPPATETATLSPFELTVVIPPTLLTPPPTFTPYPVATLPASPTSEPSPLPSATPLPPTPLPSDTPAPDLPVRFAVIGDYGKAGLPLQEVAGLIDSWEVDFIITVGDNNYPDGASDTIDENIGQYFHQYIYPYQGAYGEGADVNRFFPTLGNHDYVTYNAEPYLNYFELPGNERYYDFVWGPLHMFAVNSDEHEPDGVGESSAQAAWLKDRLIHSGRAWKVVYFHHAPYSSGLHGGTNWMHWPFEEWGASVVLAGHDHHYERLVRDGFPYFVNGLGGGAIYNVAGSEKGSEVEFELDHGAMLVTADWETITFAFYTRKGVLIDTYTLTAP